MRRFLFLLRFELKKVMARKKAFLLLLALNVIPILASLLAFFLWVKFKSLGLGMFEYSFLVQAMRGLFVAHVKLFAWISPFFLALVIGDSLSGESGRGHLKTLLLTPVTRWQILVAKGAAVLGFLLLAVALGGLFLQIDLWVARSLTSSPNMIIDVAVPDPALITLGPALRLLGLVFLANLSLVSFFLLFALFFESPILMAFASLFVLMTLQTYAMIAPHIARLDPRHETIVQWCFTRHLAKVTDLSTLQGMVEGRLFLSSPEVWEPLSAGLGWAATFFLLSLLVFQRRQILG
jgi:ABC-2 type transport system permease protein